MPFPNAFETVLRDPPILTMSAVGQQALTSLKNKGYEVHAGLTPEYADAIAVMATEQSIKEYCPKDSTERFANRQATAAWLSKRRATYLLLQKIRDGELLLAGYGWIGSKESPLVPGGDTTFSLRVGEKHQGKGLAAPFSVAMLAAAETEYGGGNLWLETWASNAGAVHVYHKLGFIDVAKKTEERPTATGQKVTDTRVYMTRDRTLQNGVFNA